MKHHPAGWEVVVGLELHAQILSQSKLFSGARAQFGGASNAQVALFDAAYPGTLPALNEECVRQAVRVGLALGGQVNLRSRFDRKHYFYCDMPSGYQITQNTHPIVTGGHLTIFPFDESRRRSIALHRVQLEQDSGKSYHDQHPLNTLVDLNRAGFALLEIISQPDLRSGEEAVEYLQKMQMLLHCVGASDPRLMDKSSLRCDVNVSVNRVGGPRGTRCEVKNVNSLKQIQRAIEYETERQIELLEGGGVIEQETRYFDPHLDRTVRLRSKEDEVDYRYFPEPDLPPLVIEEGLVEQIRAELPELPDDKCRRLVADYDLPLYDAQVLVDTYGATHFFEQAVREGRRQGSQSSSSEEPKKREEEEEEAKGSTKLHRMMASWVTSELFGRLASAGKSVEESPVTPGQVSSIVGLIHAGTISRATGKQVLDLMALGDSRLAPDIVQAKGWQLTHDASALEQLVLQVVGTYPNDVARYRSGEVKLKRFFVGEVMKASKGRADPKTINQLLEQHLAADHHPQ